MYWYNHFLRNQIWTYLFLSRVNPGEPNVFLASSNLQQPKLTPWVFQGEANYKTKFPWEISIWFESTTLHWDGPVLVTNDLLRCAAYFGMRGASHVLVRHRMLQSYISLRNCILDLSLFSCLCRNWTLPKVIFLSGVDSTSQLFSHTRSFPLGPCLWPVFFASSFVCFGVLGA